MTEPLPTLTLAFFMALSLAMDAFAVSIGLGAKHPKLAAKTAILAALYFGIAQGLMPLMGYLGGKSVLGYVAAFAPYIACTILVGLGGKMLYEAYSDSKAGTVYNSSGGSAADAPASSLTIANDPTTAINHRTMLTLAIATSIDALAAGFTLNLLSLNAYLICALITGVTALASGIGVYVGKITGTALETYAAIFGGVVLVLLGVKMLL